MDELYQRLNLAERQISQIQNKMARRDLTKMVRTINTAVVAADIESVQCRRLHKETNKYKELIQQADALITNLEQHLTFAALLGG
jgi:hypothetical protein